MNELTSRIAKHLREVCFGGNWSASSLRDQLKGVTWEQALTPVQDFNTIATLVFHMNYYIAGVSKVLDGGPLDIRDKFSFDHPPIHNQEDWDNFLAQVWRDAEYFIQQIEQLPDTILTENFTDGKYGDYFRNLHGIIEHFHYHLGQIVLLKRMVASPQG